MKIQHQDHVIVRSDDHGGSQFVCRHCEASASVASPILLDDWLAFAKAFGDRHGRCPPKENP